MMKSNKINRMPGNGCLYFPLSMSRLNNTQSPESIYNFSKNIITKAYELTIDIIFIYCNSLYLNNSSSLQNQRYKLNAQMITHRKELENIIVKDKFLPLKSFHFTPWDHFILSSTTFYEIFGILKKLSKNDIVFFNLIRHEAKAMIPNANQINFILEETIITYLIRERFIRGPSFFSNINAWHLICYPGRCLTTDVYIYQNKLLPSNNKIIHENYFSQMAAAARFNLLSEKIEFYSEVDLADHNKRFSVPKFDEVT